MLAVVVSDTSPIRALHHLGLESLMPALFSTTLVPPAVMNELVRALGDSTARTMESRTGIQVQVPSNHALIAELATRLDPGESEALALAIEVRAGAILIDESRGRRSAERMGLLPLGMVGILLRAKAHHLVPAVAPLLDRLQCEFRFFLNQSIVRRALIEAGELTE